MMTRRRGSIMAPLAVLMVLMVVLLATPTNAVIHEDEVGQRDWMMRLVGDVRQAVVPTMRNPSQIIVSSAEGAVASLDISPAGAVNLTWREIFSEHPHCIAASSNGVAVIGESGTLSILNLLTGFVEVAYRLAPSSHGLSACTMQGEEVSVVLVDGTQAKVFRMDINSNEETVAPMTTIDLGSGKLSSLHLAGAETLLVGQDAGVRRYSTSTGELQATHEGRCTSSTPTGSFVIATAAKSVLYQVAADSTVNEGTEVCSRCATIAVDEVNPAPHAVYFVSTPGAEKITIHFPSDVQVAISRPPVEDIGIMPLIAMRSSGRVFTLIKTMENHLMLINDDDARPLVWERYEGLAHPAAAIIAMPVKGHIDHFHFNQELIAISDKGIIYVVPLAGMGQQVQVLHSIGSMLASILGASSMAEVKINSLTITPDNTPLLTVSASARGSTALMQINRVSGVAQFLTKEKDMLLLSPNLQVSSELVVKGKLGGREELFLYTAKVGQTELRGYSIRADAPKATPMWSINTPYPIVALASADEDHARFANHLRVYRNVTGKEVEEEVHRRYPTENTLAVAYYEPSEDALHTLVVMAVDTITGNVLATTRHASVEGPIHMVVVENNILFHFLDAAKMRYCIGVWEMFESEGGHTMRKDAGATIPQIIASFFGGAPRVFSSRATRPPRVAAMTLGLFGGPIADMAATTSEQAIARKSIVLAFESGRVAVVDLNRLLAGGQMRMAQEPDAPQLTHVVIPSVGLASHRQRLALPQRIITASTRLESSSHVVVAGLDLFYIRSSSGKPFDVLNTDFNKQLLISLVGGFAGLSVVVRYLVVRKSLSNQWK